MTRNASEFKSEIINYQTRPNIVQKDSKQSTILKQKKVLRGEKKIENNPSYNNNKS